MALRRGMTAAKAAETAERVLAVRDKSRKARPLEGMKVNPRCEMCGRGNEHKGYPLEPAFAPDGVAMTLCRPCRIGSAEILEGHRSELLRQLKALVVQITHSGRLVVPPHVQHAITAAERGGIIDPYALVVVHGGVADLAIAENCDVDILDIDNLKETPVDDMRPFSDREEQYLAKEWPELFAAYKSAQEEK